jgi:hypothetical protein
MSLEFPPAQNVMAAQAAIHASIGNLSWWKWGTAGALKIRSAR